MSGFAVSSRAAGPWPSVFFSLPARAAAGRQSATAAAQTAMSTGRAASTSASISRALSTRRTATPGGSGRLTGPRDQGDLRPGLGQGLGDGVALASGRAVGDVADRIDRLVRRTAGHERPPSASGRETGAAAGLPSSARIAARMSSRLGHPAAADLAARHVAGIGPDEAGRHRPAAARHSAGSPHGCHIIGFMAGATSTGLSVASSAVEARSSAWPCAIFAMRSAVAGATTTRSASRDSRIWPISASSVSEKSSS